MLVAALTLPLAGRAADLPPDRLVRNTADEVLSIIRNDPDIITGDMRKLTALVEEKILGHFDFMRMTRLAAGKNWRAASEPQREALTNEFRTLLIRTYAVALAQFQQGTIGYAPLEQRDAHEAVVHTTVTQASGKPIRMDYRMTEDDDGWKVYDILVDGVSLVINYRGQFDSTVEQSGIDGLIEMIAHKNSTAGQ
jgi:phospholipid transport system substrate-binding protein